MKKFLLLIPALLLTLATNAAKPIITIDGDKSDWADVPMLSEPGTWPMLKVLPAADANIGTNALVYMLENTADFANDWSKYPGSYIDKDYNIETNPAGSWVYPDMGIDYSGTTGVNPGTGWISFPKAVAADNKVIEMGLPATWITDLESKFGIGMFYGTGSAQEWFIPKREGNEIDSKKGFLYKTRSFTTLPGSVTAANAFAHQCIGECTSYVDFGLRDNGYDTIRWAAFPVELTKPGLYSVTTNVTSSNGWKFEFWLVDVATNRVVAHLPAPESNVSSSKTSYNFGKLDLTSVPAGKYMLKVKNRTAYSKVKLSSIDIAYAGGALVDISQTLLPADAMLSDSAGVVSGSPDYINFKVIGSHKYNDREWAKWRIHTDGGNFTFTVNADNPTEGTSHKYTIQVYAPDDEANPLLNETSSSTSAAGAFAYTTNTVALASGEYIVKVWNPTSWSVGNLVNVVPTYKGGATADIPATLLPEDAILSTRAWVDKSGVDDVVRFTPVGSEGYNDQEWAKWKIKVAKAGKYKFTANVYSTNGQYYKISVLNSSESSTVGEKDGTGSSLGSGNKSFATDDIELAAGEYVLKIANTYNYSTGCVLNIVAVYNGGAVTAIPGALIAGDAVIVSPNKKLHHDENACLHYNDNGTPTNEYAYWKIHADAPYSGKVTLDIPEENSSGHQFHVELYSALDEAKLSEAYEATDNHSKRLIELEQTFTISDAGDYFIKVINHTKWSSSILRQVIIAPSISNIDEDEDDINAVIGANDGKAVNVQLNRTFVAGMYNTICLPFAVSAAEMARVFPGAVIKELTAASIDEGDYVLNLSFSAVSEMVAGKPYIIKPAADIANPRFMGVTIDKTLRPVDVGKVKFLGNTVAGTISASEDNLFIGANNTLYFPLNDIEILGMRAYFQIKSGVRALVKGARIVEHESTATGIENIMEQPRLAGQKVFENGQIVIIRDGIRYNIMGVRMN